MGASIQRHQRRKGRGQVGGDDLEHVLGLRQILEAMVPEVDHARVGGYVVADQAGRRLREEDLPAMPEIPEPGAAVDGRAVVVPVAQLGLAGVDPDADRDRPRRWPGLDGEAALN